MTERNVSTTPGSAGFCRQIEYSERAWSVMVASMTIAGSAVPACANENIRWSESSVPADTIVSAAPAWWASARLRHSNSSAAAELGVAVISSDSALTSCDTADGAQVAAAASGLAIREPSAATAWSRAMAPMSGLPAITSRAEWSEPRLRDGSAPKTSSATALSFSATVKWRTSDAAAACTLMSRPAPSAAGVGVGSCGSPPPLGSPVRRLSAPANSPGVRTRLARGSGSGTASAATIWIARAS
mmetsp:Transcript_3625/g.7558  ORF Transcript_3625/g.7558 Transcript_3625/m.7558 type:complete len:244 (-) Transcript_3625:277-1008(-)